MTTNPSTVLFASVLLAGTVFGTSALAAEQFGSTRYGYSLDLPSGWVEIPEEMLQALVDVAIKQDTQPRIVYDAAFQLKDADQWFEYPYVLVQPITYASYGVNRQINEDEFPECVKKLTGLNIEEILDETASSDVRQLIDKVETGQPKLEMSERRYLWNINMDVAGIGPVRGLVVGYFGRDSVVQVIFYARRSDWDRYADVRRAIVDSFRFASDKGYSEEIAAANPTPPSLWRGTLAKCVTGAIVGGLTAAILAIRRKKQASAKNTMQDASE